MKIIIKHIEILLEESRNFENIIKGSKMIVTDPKVLDSLKDGLT
jgi:hypothetical protein